MLTYCAKDCALEALELGTKMVDALDAYTRLTRTRPEGSDMNTLGATVNCLTDGDPDTPPVKEWTFTS